MALKKSNIEITVTIDSIELTYKCSPSEAELLQKAEELINKEINSFRNNFRTPDYNKMLIILMIKFVMASLRKESDAEDTMTSLKEINSQLAEYLHLSKTNA
ncbi:MAG: cell division protein ZapA [Bacteroidales bacterium]|nr:cell division protein ZapA [Bacteroidales bacterium]